PRLDGAAKTDGSAKFTMDFAESGMLTALIARPPRFGAAVRSFDAIGSRRVKGVTHVVRVPSGVAVVATSFWAARKGRDALRVSWDENRAEKRGSDDLFAAYRVLARSPGKPARREGDVARALRSAPKVFEAVYEFPYLAHAPMEPLDAVVRIGADGCDLWAGSQIPTIDQQVVAGIDQTSVEGASTLPYAIPNITVELHTTSVGVPVLWWRSVGSSHTAFSTETFLDELAHAAGRDPLEMRRSLLAGHPRHLATLNLAAEEAGWDQPLPAGRARGIAVHESFDSVVAQIAEVSRRPDGLPKVERVVCAVDCGIAINPDGVRAQMEGGIGFGLAAALWSEITLVRGRVQQRNFDGYRPLRINDMPAVEVHIVPSGAAPTGVGEPGVPPIAPAVANALYQLTGQRVRRLPFARLAPAGTRTA